MAVSKYFTKSGEVRYKATIWHHNQAQASQSFKRKVDADSWLAREKVHIEDQRVGRLKGQTMTLSKFFTEIYFPNHGVRESTAIDYLRIFKNHIEPVVGDRMLLSIDEADWAKLFRGLMKAGMSPARTNRIRSCIARVYSFAIEWQYARQNPVLLVKCQEEALSDFRYWSEEDTNRFLTWTHEKQRQSFLLYHFLYETGVRISEAIGLQWDCVNLTNGTIEIRRSYCRIMKRIESSTKGKKKRVLGINSSLKETLITLYNQRRSEFVFSKENGQPICYAFSRNRFVREQKAVGVSEIGLHDLRHTFASHFVMSGGSIYDLKDLLGHSDIKTTEIYAHLAPNHLISKASVVQFQLPKVAGVVSLKSANHFPTIARELNVSQAEESLSAVH
jgi:site-specific recombinase XerD